MKFMSIEEIKWTESKWNHAPGYRKRTRPFGDDDFDFDEDPDDDLDLEPEDPCDEDFMKEISQ